MQLTVTELRASLSFLRQAKSLCESVRDLLHARDVEAAARLSEVVTRIDYEREFLERLNASAGNGAVAFDLSAIAPRRKCSGFLH